MNRTLFYLSLAGIAVVLQTALLPPFLQGDYKPDLVLLLVVYLGLHEDRWRGGLLVYLMGWLFDGVGGAFPGLYGFVLLTIFLAVRGIVSRVNTESSALLLLLVAFLARWTALVLRPAPLHHIGVGVVHHPVGQGLAAHHGPARRAGGQPDEQTETYRNIYPAA